MAGPARVRDAHRGQLSAHRPSDGAGPCPSRRGRDGHRRPRGCAGDLLAEHRAARSAGPRSPKVDSSSLAKASSKEARRRGAAGCPRSRQQVPRCALRHWDASAWHRCLPPACDPEPADSELSAAGGSPASDSETLPCGSISSTRTSTSWPRVTTSSTRSTLRALAEARDVDEAVTAGKDVDEGPELGDVHDLARVDGAHLGRRRVEDQLDAAAGLVDDRALLGADRDRADLCRRRRRSRPRRSPAGWR